MARKKKAFYVHIRCINGDEFIGEQNDEWDEVYPLRAALNVVPCDTSKEDEFKWTVHQSLGDLRLTSAHILYIRNIASPVFDGDSVCIKSI